MGSGSVSICPRCQLEFTGGELKCPHDGRRLLTTAAGDSERVGQVIDESFTILGHIGSGGMGAVYRALQHSMEREVALKLLRKDLVADADTVRRFLREARAASQLAHPNIITLFDFGQTAEGELYIVMELLKGRSLRELIAVEGALSAERACAITYQICDALQVAHDNKVVHRDLKPDNIFVLGGAGNQGEFVKLLDFGIAKFKGEDVSAITANGAVCGTPAYMSPEQVIGKVEVDRRTDIYAAGVVLYEMLAGRPPFRADTPVGVMMAHVHERADPLRVARPDIAVPAQVEELLMRTLSKTIARRPQSAVELKNELSAAMGAFHTIGLRTGLRGVDSTAGTPAPPSDLALDTLDAEYTLGESIPMAVPLTEAAFFPEASRRTRWPLLLILALGAVVGLLVLDRFVGNRDHGTSSPAPDATSSPVVVARGPTDVPVVASSAPATDPHPAVGAERRSDRRPPAPPWRVVSIDTVPAGASVTLGGKPKGQTPVQLRLNYGEEGELVLTHAGFSRWVRSVDPSWQPESPIRLQAEPELVTKKPTRRPPRKPAGKRRPKTGPGDLPFVK